MRDSDYRIAGHLPSSIDRENLREVARVIDAQMEELNRVEELVGIYYRIDELSSDLIDALAIQLHVDFYDEKLPLATRRELVKNSTRWHLRKGTAGVVEEMVQTVFETGVVKEWPEYGGNPYYFRVEVLTAPQITPENLKLITYVIETVKNVRSWLEGLGFLREIPAPIYFAAGTVIAAKYENAPRCSDALAGGAVHLTAPPIMSVKYEVAPRYAESAKLTGEVVTGSGLAIHKSYLIKQKEGA